MKSLFDMTLGELREHLKITSEKIEAAKDRAEYNRQSWRWKMCAKLIGRKEAANE